MVMNEVFFFYYRHCHRLWTTQNETHRLSLHYDPSIQTKPLQSPRKLIKI